MKHCQQEMTVIQNAWPVVCNFGWLIEADRNARKGKRYRAEVLNFTARLEDNLFTIQQGMMNGSYVLGPYRKLWVYVPKKRLVMALDYPDRIVQWSLYLYLNPLYDRLFLRIPTLAERTRAAIRPPSACNTGCAKCSASRGRAGTA